MIFVHADLIAAARGDPEGFVAGVSGSVVLDEIQRAPDLYRAIKAAVDRDRRPGRFLLTGSANALLLPQLADALVGRMEIVTLWPLSRGEISGLVEGFVDALFGRDAPAVTARGLGGPYPSRRVSGGRRRRRGRSAERLVQRIT